MVDLVTSIYSYFVWGCFSQFRTHPVLFVHAVPPHHVPQPWFVDIWSTVAPLREQTIFFHSNGSGWSAIIANSQRLKTTLN